MRFMAKRKKDEAGQSEPANQPMSRANTRYIALPLNLYDALVRYAKDHSDEDDVKSISWAGRKAVRVFLTGEGYWPPATSQ